LSASSARSPSSRPRIAPCSRSDLGPLANGVAGGRTDDAGVEGSAAPGHHLSRRSTSSCGASIMMSCPIGSLCVRHAGSSRSRSYGPMNGGCRCARSRSLAGLCDEARWVCLHESRWHPGGWMVELKPRWAAQGSPACLAASTTRVGKLGASRPPLLLTRASRHPRTPPSAAMFARRSRVRPSPCSRHHLLAAVEGVEHG